MPCTCPRVIACSSPRRSACHGGGFTLLELLLAVAVVAILAAIAIPSYQQYVTRARVAQAEADVRQIELRISQYSSNHSGAMPASLADIGANNLLDPWGQTYRFLDLTNPANLKDARKDKQLHPLNSDFDLYSTGADMSSQLPLTAKASQDDIVRANNGGFIGLASDY